MNQKNETPARKKNAQKPKTSLRRLSKLAPPTPAELKKAIEAKKALAKKPLAGDINTLNSVQLEEAEKFETINFSDDWFEFSVFCKKLHTGPATITKWLDNGWLAYSEIGRVRLINKGDFEDTMRRFRKPAIWCLGYITMLLNDFNALEAFV